MHRRSTLLCLLFFLAAAALVVDAWAKDYRLELTIITDKQEEFVLMVELDERQFKKLQNNAQIEIQPYLVQARKEYAGKIGYRTEIYGAENFKMVTVRSFTFVVKDISQGRVVLKK